MSARSLLNQVGSPCLRPLASSFQEGFKIEDENLNNLREKYKNSHEIYIKCLEMNPKASLDNSDSFSFINHNSLYDLDINTQDKLTQIMLKKLQKDSFLRGLTLYPATVHDNINKKLGIRTSTFEFQEKLCRHFQKSVYALKVQQRLLFKKTVQLSLQDSTHNQKDVNLKLALEAYKIKIDQQKTVYTEIWHRLSHGLLKDQNDPPNIGVQPGNKLLFNNQSQPPPHKIIRTTDYKLYLSDLSRKYKTTRSLRKFKEVIKHLPVSILDKLYPMIDKNNYRRNAISSEELGSEMRKDDPIQRQRRYKEEFVEYQNIKDLNLLREKLIALCVKNGLMEDINKDNGAFLLFKVDSYYKEAYQKQQVELNFLTEGEQEERTYHYVKEEHEEYLHGEEIAQENKERVRYIKKVTWKEDFLDYDEVSNTKKLEKAVYEDRFDSLLESWFEFVQIRAVKESAMKIEFRVNRLKESYKEKKVAQQQIFYEFLKAYLKLLVLQARRNVIRIYDYLNLFTSIKKNVYIRRKENHIPMKGELARSISKIAGGDVSIGDGEASREEKSTPKKDYFSFKVIESLQEDEVTFDDNLVNVIGNGKVPIMYDTVRKDFEKLSKELLSLGAHLIDTNKERKLEAGSFNPVLDDLSREAIVTDLLEQEAEYLFSKAKYVVNLNEILSNIFTVKHSTTLIRYIQETIANRPQFSLFEISVTLSYTEETEYYNRLSAIGSSLIETQKSEENNFNDYQQQLYSQEELNNLPYIQRPPIEAISRSNLNLIIDGKPEGTQLPTETRETQKEFEKIKPYSTLADTFLALSELENMSTAAMNNVNIEEMKLATKLDVRRMVLDEAFEVWNQLRYNLTPVTSLKEYEDFECDVLLDIPDSSYNYLSTLLKIPSPRSETMNLKPNSRVFDPNTKPDTPKRSLLNEEEYLKNLVQFLRLKEILFASLLSSAYQARVYLYQVKLFGKENMYEKRLGRSNHVQRDFLSLLLSSENIHHFFDMKQLKDSKSIALSPSKLESLRLTTEYLLLHEAVLQNAVNMNHLYILDVTQVFKGDNGNIYKALKNSHSQSVFYNVVARKNEWFIKAKINPNQMLNKTLKVEVAGETSSAGKVEQFIEVMKHIRKGVYQDALKMQVIKVSRIMRELVQKLHLG